MTNEKARPQAKQPSSTPSLIEDAFWLLDLYPDAAALFEHAPATIKEVAADSFVALDANVLLWPYEFNSASLAEVDRVYAQLCDAGRLVVPGQAAREFYKHRARKLASLSENIDGAILRAKRQIFDNSVPILQDDPEYKSARELAKAMLSTGRQLADKLEVVKAKLQSDVGTDPVSAIYRKHLPSTVVELNIATEARSDLVAEAERRARLRIAPGYKDQAKSDGGLGDLIIWKTILQQASIRKTNCLFVTNEEKSDWWVKSGGAFQPRPELLDEYRRASDGATIHLLPLSELLSVFSAKAEVVQGVQKLEEESRNRDVLEHDRFRDGMIAAIGRNNANRIAEITSRRDELARQLGRVDSQLSETSSILDSDPNDEVFTNIHKLRLLMSSERTAIVRALEENALALKSLHAEIDSNNARNRWIHS